MFPSLIAQLKNYKKVFEHILDMEKKVDLANKHLVSYSCKSHQLMIANIPTCECEYEQQSMCKPSAVFV